MVYRKDLIITIDGPSGAGKSTIAKLLARELGYTFIDTGAMYRGIACACKAREGEPVESILKDLPLRFEFKGETRVYLDGADISQEIREPHISLLASSLSQQSVVREYLYQIQRDIGKNGGVVLEGRDTGSVVFPHAHVKFYLDASPDERAKRRHTELAAKGDSSELATVREEMAVRDRNDSERQIAPLVIPEGAHRVDTTGIDVPSVLAMLLKYIAGESAR
ncbi:MAG TPA: (d)CMP kinase [Syntrophorhabdaceae bacterium]|nr:(d)CMP kinase [Syntrophorhabdaceae bacterium]